LAAIGEDFMAGSNGEKIVPLISSGTAGPSGVLHLPRLWTKLMLYSAGRLPGDYDFCGQGYDQMTLDALGLDRSEVIKFVTDKRPTYIAFEQWVVQKNGGKLNSDAVKKHNAAVLGYNHAPELAGSMRKASGLGDAPISDAVSLNTLEDLDALHQSLRH
jgi:hypothetical protein